MSAHPLIVPTQKRSIFFKPEGLDRAYKMSVTFSGSATSSVEYKVGVRHIETVGDRRYVVEITREDVAVNGRTAEDALAAELAQKCGNVFYPLQVLVNSVGRILSIHNYKDITKRWNETIDALSRYYIGEPASAYIAHTNSIIQDYERFKQSLSGEWFLHLYFAPLSLPYDRDNRNKLPIPYPVLPFKKPIIFEVDQYTAQAENPEITVVKQNGRIAESQPILGVYDEVGTTHESNPNQYISSGSMEVSYTLDSQTCFINSAQGKWEVSEEGMLRTIAVDVICTSDDGNI